MHGASKVADSPRGVDHDLRIGLFLKTLSPSAISLKTKPFKVSLCFQYSPPLLCRGSGEGASQICETLLPVFCCLHGQVIYHTERRPFKAGSVFLRSSRGLSASTVMRAVLALPSRLHPLNMPSNHASLSYSTVYETYLDVFFLLVCLEN